MAEHKYEAHCACGASWWLFGPDVDVDGTITTYEGAPEIIVNDPTQVRPAA